MGVFLSSRCQRYAVYTPNCSLVSVYLLLVPVTTGGGRLSQYVVLGQWGSNLLIWPVTF